MIIYINISIKIQNSISFSERFNNYLKANEQGGIVKDVQIKPLINKKVMDTESYGFTQGLNQGHNKDLNLRTYFLALVLNIFITRILI